MNKVRFGVIGIGFFGEKHVDTLQGLRGVSVGAICTRRQNRLDEVARKYNIPKTYTDYNDLLADPEIDAVTIVTHASDHLKPTLAALNADKHVFLEKPMALTTFECDQIVEAAKANDKLFMVGHICRFETNYAMAKKEVDAGSIGKILYIHSRRNLSALVTDGVLEKISPISGDCIHDIDIMQWLICDKVKKVYAATARMRNLNNPDIGVVTLHFGQGAIAVSECVWCLPATSPYQLDARMEIIGDKGAIYINDSNPPFVMDNDAGRYMCDTYYWPKVLGQRVGALKEELEYFTRCIEDGVEPTVITPEESREAVRIVEAAEKSAKTGRVVLLE